MSTQETQVRTLDTKSLAALEMRSLQKVFTDSGADAFDREARVLLIQQATLIAHVGGRDRLTEALALIEIAVQS